jgi:leader peptidase (prepilin peptidase) / N-methyltransferase
MLARRLQKAPPSDTGLDIRAKAMIICVAMAAVAASIAVAPNASGVLAAGLALVVVAIAIIDARWFTIPDELSIVGFALGLAHAGLVGHSVLAAPVLAMLRGSALALIFLAVGATYQQFRGRQGIGLGDVKLAAVAGVWLDWHMIPIAVEIAAIAALAVYLTRQLALGRSVRLTSRLPFGLFLAPAIWVGWALDVWLLAP